MKHPPLILRVVLAASCLSFALAAQQLPAAFGNVSYGNTGDPYMTEGSKPSCKKMLNECGKELSGGNYCLAADVSAKPDAGGKCFTFSAGTKLDLQGHTITGRVFSHVDAQGAHIFNGTVTCDYADRNGDAGCVTISASSPPYLDKPAELHHLTIRNMAANAVSRGIFVDWKPREQKARFGVRIYNTTISTPTCMLEPNTVCIRVNAVRVQSEKAVALGLEAFNNDWTCSADTNACQGLELFEVGNSHIHHNRITMALNLLPETGRAIDCDGDHIPGSKNCEVDQNYIIANNHRAFRVRSSANAHFHDNYVANCMNTVSGCVYLYDQGSVPEDYGDMRIERNTFEMNGGVALFLRCGKGAVVRDNVIKGSGERDVTGLFANVTSWGEGCTTDATFLRNGIVADPNIKVTSNAPATAAATVCDSGVVQGTGRIVEQKDCP